MPAASATSRMHKAGEIKGGLAWAQLAAALNQVGEPGRARLAFGLAQRHIDERDPHDYYGTPLRDRAALLALASEGRRPRGRRRGDRRGAQPPGLPRRGDDHAGEGLAVLAAHALGGSGELAYSVDGQQRKAERDPAVINPDAAAVERGLKVKNEAANALWLPGHAARACRRSRSPRPPMASASRAPTTRSMAARPISRRYARTNRVVVSLAGRNLEATTTRWRCSTSCRPASRSNRW